MTTADSFRTARNLVKIFKMWTGLLRFTPPEYAARDSVNTGNEPPMECRDELKRNIVTRLHCCLHRRDVTA